MQITFINTIIKLTIYTKELKIYNQVLFVKVTSSVLRQELLMNRKSLVKRLNDHVKAQVITDIVFR